MRITKVFLENTLDFTFQNSIHFSGFHLSWLISSNRKKEKRIDYCEFFRPPRWRENWWRTGPGIVRRTSHLGRGKRLGLRPSRWGPRWRLGQGTSRLCWTDTVCPAQYNPWRPTSEKMANIQNTASLSTRDSRNETGSIGAPILATNRSGQQGLKFISFVTNSIDNFGI